MKPLIEALESQHGVQSVALKDPFQLLLWENVVYLANDNVRAAAFETLRSRIGLTPQKILKAKRKDLLEATKLGKLAPLQAEKLETIARLGKPELNGDLAHDRKVLRAYPAIGAPGADRILLMSGAHAVFTLESNGLRVLARVVLGNELASYDKTYKAVMEAAPNSDDLQWLQRAVLVLKKHGQEVCTRNAPKCDVCAARKLCRYASV